MSSGPDSTEPQVPAPECVPQPDDEQSASATRESIMLRNLAAAQHDRIATLQARLDHDDDATDDEAPTAPIANWPRSVVEELDWTRARLAETRHKASQLEQALAERTRWARDLENEALARTRWALQSDRRLQRYARALDRALGPGDDAELFLKSSALLWRATWPLRFVHRLARRFFARRLWNPLEWPGWFRRMKAAYAAHGARGFLHVGTRTERDPDSRRRG
jgi:hypothetical protein